MELSRRDAVLALGAVGVGGGGLGAAADAVTSEQSDGSVPDRTVEGLLAVAEVVHPSAVATTEEFVRTYVVGRIDARPAYREGVVQSVEDIAAESRERTGRAFPQLSADDRDSILRSMGVGTAVPDPDGTVAERARYYVVNELLYALYASPTGAQLLGHEHPTGFPGGREAYQRGPE
jgi:hypothetical protein